MKNKNGAGCSPTPFKNQCVSASAQTKITIVMMVVVMSVGVEQGEVHGGHCSSLSRFCQNFF
ncbi:MAG: hypothetical protein HZB77_16960 [Chloroflexi bacterium]|nr:hypothetical protein [Chloroflexota bacterium]